MMSLRKMAEINAAHGLHWFDCDTLRFFKTRFCGRVFYGNKGDGVTFHFVTSERSPWGRRMYTVRTFNATTGETETAEGFTFQGFSDRRTALAACAKLAAS